MLNKIFVAVLLLSLFLSGNAALAGKKTLVLPAADKSQAVISLGKKNDPGSGKMVEGYAIIHYKEKLAKPSGRGGGSQCYGFLAKGAKWKIVEPWLVNTSNVRSLDQTSVFNVLANGIAKWESAAGVNIFGGGI